MHDCTLGKAIEMMRLINIIMLMKMIIDENYLNKKMFFLIIMLNWINLVRNDYSSVRLSGNWIGMKKQKMKRKWI